MRTVIIMSVLGLIYCAFLLGFPRINFTNAEIFTAMRHVENLVDTEEKLAAYLSYYINEEEGRLARIREFLQRSEHLLKISSDEEVSQYVGNPFNLIGLLKRLYKDWGQVERLLSIDFSQGKNQSSSECLFQFYLTYKCPNSVEV